MKYLKKFLKYIANFFTKPVKEMKLINEVRSQMQFWHKEELTATKNARIAFDRKDYNTAITYTNQSKTARIRCDTELSRLGQPYKKKTSKDMIKCADDLIYYLKECRKLAKQEKNPENHW